MGSTLASALRYRCFLCLDAAKFTTPLIILAKNTKKKVNWDSNQENRYG
jgi:hypothetical protein